MGFNDLNRKWFHQKHYNVVIPSFFSNKYRSWICHVPSPLPSCHPFQMSYRVIYQSIVLTNPQCPVMRTPRQFSRMSMVFGMSWNSLSFQLPSSLQQDLPSLKNKIDQLLRNITAKIYRGDNSTDCMTCKIHCHFHITDDIKYFGPPIGYDASTGECNLKWWAKSISKTARKCGQGIFLEQTSRRVSENRLLLRA